MNEITCPECGSINVKRQEGYLGINESEPSEPDIVPNECLEENCRHKWYDEK